MVLWVSLGGREMIGMAFVHGLHIYIYIYIYTSMHLYTRQSPSPRTHVGWLCRWTIRQCYKAETMLVSLSVCLFVVVSLFGKREREKERECVCVWEQVDRYRGMYIVLDKAGCLYIARTGM